MSDKFIPQNELEKRIVDDLFDLQDIKYRDFHAKLIPNVDKNKIIGVRVPLLRKYAKKLVDEGLTEEILSLDLPLYFFEEYHIWSFIISQIKDYERVIHLADEFLTFVDNWAICDSFSPKVFRKNHDKLEYKISEWIKSEHTYVRRFAIVTLLNHFLDEDFDIKYLKWVADAECDDYYINMAVAWYFSFALIKQYESTIDWFKVQKLGSFVHNKSIQKACESYRIDIETKKYLKTLKV